MREMRKHFRLMTKEERLYLLRIRDSIILKNEPIINNHTFYRMYQRNINKKYILNTLKYGTIVEYREIYNDKNEIIDKVITLRSVKLYDNKHVIVVWSMIYNRVKTTYFRNLEQTLNKKTFDMFDKNIDIINSIRVKKRKNKLKY